jgi:hypothetical protein
MSAAKDDPKNRWGYWVRRAQFAKAKAEPGFSWEALGRCWKQSPGHLNRDCKANSFTPKAQGVRT